MKKKKPYKIVKTKKFEEAEKKLPKAERDELEKVLKAIANNPTETPNSMQLYGPPSAKELKQWMSETEAYIIDEMFEYLNDKNCLNKKGTELAKEFWEKYIKVKGGKINEKRKSK